MIPVPAIIETDSNLKLRLLQPEDAPRLFRLIDDNRDYLNPWLDSIKYIVDIATALNFIQKSLGNAANNEAFRYGIWVDDQFVGTVGAHTWRHDVKLLELSYWLGKEFTGQGIMTRACHCLIGEMFRTDRARVVEIHTDQGNRRSTAVAQRLLFQYVDQIKDVSFTRNVYQIRSEEWE